MLHDAEAFSEAEWQAAVADLFLLIFPQYVAVLSNVLVKERYSNPGRETKRYIDLLLVSANGEVDVIEIKKPFERSLVSKVGIAIIMSRFENYPARLSRRRSIFSTLISPDKMARCILQKHIETVFRLVSKFESPIQRRSSFLGEIVICRQKSGRTLTSHGVVIRT